MAVKPAIVKLEHHEQQELCQTRAPYRQGRKLTAVKVALTKSDQQVYTINDESQHLMICGVPQLQLREDIKRIFLPYGSIKKVELVPDYPTEEFTDVFHVHYERIQSARIAKRFVDGKNFYGGLLHVFYAPELESIAETRNKLIQRRKDVAVRIKRHAEDPTNLETDKFEPREQFHRKKKFPTLPLTEQRLAQHYPSESLTTIYDGIPRDIDPRPVSEPSLPANWSRENQQETSGQSTSDSLQAPYNKSDALGRVVTSMGERKRKNYRGRPVNEGVKVRVIRPQIVDTTKLGNFSNQIEKKVFPVVKKVDSGITIKVLPKKDEGKKRIVLKDPSVSRLVQPSDDLRASIKMVKSNIRDAMKNS